MIPNTDIPIKLAGRTRVFLLLVVICLLLSVPISMFARTPKVMFIQTRQTSLLSKYIDNHTDSVKNHCQDVQNAAIQTNLDILLRILRDPNSRQTCAWIRMRISQMWSSWLKAIRSLEQKQDLSNRRKRKVLMYLGFLSKKANWGFAELQFKGGALGELVVWSDLIASLYILGHDVKVTTEFEELKHYTDFLTLNQSMYNNQSTCKQPDNIIYTDIVGLKHISSDIGVPYDHYKCRLRILDCFGVHAAFNHKQYAERTDRVTFWGGLNLRLQQFYNMFPHTPDDTFLGFVVRSNISNGEQLEKDNIVLVYGKSAHFWKGKNAYLSQFKKAGFSVHGTVQEASREMPSFIINHKILHGGEFQRLLCRTKIFLGLGQPPEGPAALEAIAHGAVFINPKIEPPIDYRTLKKPTERKIRSQHPYIEEFIGQPYAYTVNTTSMTDVDAAIQNINNTNKFTAFRPYEFTEEGYIQKLNSFVEHQNFCNFKNQKWPPDSAVTLIVGDAGVSCKDTCWNNNLICEPSHFYGANTTDIFKTHNIVCNKELVEPDIYYPAVNVETNTCILQGDELLLSCVGEKDTLRRVCPCRTYVKYQSALCKGCT